MSTNLFTQAAASSIQQGRDESAHEEAKIGAAAERKRAEESALSMKAWGESADQNGRAVSWQRRIRANGEVRLVTMWERDGAYAERDFLRLANRAAANAVPGGWKNSEAVESVAAEIVARVMSKTYGRMPKRGSLATSDKAADPDFAYLVSMGRFIAADALAGDCAGLSAEVAPMAAGEGAAVADLSTLAAESLAAAESAPEADPYIDPSIDPLTSEATEGVAHIALHVGERPKAVSIAITTALRPNAQAADLAQCGYGSSAGAIRKSASVGRGLLISALAEAEPAAEDDEPGLLEAVSNLCDMEEAERIYQHMLEDAPPSYKAPKLPEYLPSQKVDADEQAWNSPTDLLDYPSAALKR